MSFLNLPRVVLTGANGYLGSFVAKSLAEKAVPISILQFHDFIRGVNEPEARRILNECDVICHLAGVHPHQASLPTDTSYYWEANVHGTCKLLAAAPVNSRVVFASSAMAANSDARKNSGRALLAYAGSKRAAELMISDRWGTSISLRFQALAGSNRFPSAGLIDAAMRAAKDGTVLKINRSAHPREYLHVTDAAAAVVAACLRPINGNAIVDIGSGCPHSIATVISTVESIIGRSIERQEIRSRIEPIPRVSDLAVAAALLDWYPSRSDLHQIVADQWNELQRQERKVLSSSYWEDFAK